MNGSERLRVAHVTATFPPYPGGTGNVAWHNARELARLGHAVAVLTAALGGEAPAPDGVQVRQLRPLIRSGNAPLLPGLLPALRGFDLIHLHYPFFFGAEIVHAASRLFGIPYLVTYHHDVELAGRLAPLPQIYHRLAGLRVLAGARRLLFTTRDYGRSSFAAPLVDLPASGELPNGVDVQRFQPRLAGDALRREHRIEGRDVLALFVGGLDRAHYFKGLPVLLEAVRRVAAPRLRLLVVGGGDRRPSFERRVLDLGLADRVRFAGRVEDSRLPRYYAAADFAVLPSTTRGEAFGLVLLEAMACARPVIASALPGVRAVVQGTGGGLLVSPGDVDALAAAMRALAADPLRRAQLGAAGRRAVEATYAWPLVGKRLDAVYRDVVAAPARPAAPATTRVTA
jgi:glycosyltransferase involved in cell wall biosynthesis